MKLLILLKQWNDFLPIGFDWKTIQTLKRRSLRQCLLSWPITTPCDKPHRNSLQNIKGHQHKTLKRIEIMDKWSNIPFAKMSFQKKDYCYKMPSQLRIGWISIIFSQNSSLLQLLSCSEFQLCVRMCRTKWNLFITYSFIQEMSKWSIA